MDAIGAPAHGRQSPRISGSLALFLELLVRMAPPLLPDLEDLDAGGAAWAFTWVTWGGMPEAGVAPKAVGITEPLIEPMGTTAEGCVKSPPCIREPLRQLGSRLR